MSAEPVILTVWLEGPGVESALDALVADLHALGIDVGVLRTESSLDMPETWLAVVELSRAPD